MGYVDKRDKMAYSYSISHCTWKWMKKLFFHLLHLTILNSHILVKSCGSKLSHRDFRLTLVRNMVELAGPQSRPLQPAGRPSALATRIGRLQESSRQHWPTTIEKRMDCVVCHARTKKMPNSNKV
jgi:hypothetical protein